MSLSRVAILATTLAVSASAWAGCASSSDATAGKTQIVAAFYPLAYVAQRVAGTHADVRNLTSPGLEPHDLEATPRDVVAIAGVDLVIIEKTFQPAIDEAAEQNAEGDVFDVSSVVDLNAEDGQVDPHFWQDPERMGALADSIAARLAKLDPDHAAAYATGAAALQSDLKSLDAHFASGLGNCQRNTIVVSHDAFEYLAKYGLQIESIVGLSPGAEPTPGDLARLRDLIESDGVTTVFSETLVSPEVSETLANEAGVSTAVLDPIEGLSDQTADEDYLSIMRNNLAALQQANGC